VSDFDPFADLPLPDLESLDADLRTLESEGPAAWPSVKAPGTATDADIAAQRDDDDEAEPSIYGDVAALLAGTLPEAPAPEVLTRADGHALFYAGQVSTVFGDPESGKTWVALAAVTEVLRDGGRAIVLDLDHGGMAPTVSRLLLLGAPRAALADPSRFRYTDVDDHVLLACVVEDTVRWKPDVVIVDSMGELLPIFGASSNSPDDFTAVHAKVLKPLAKAGAAVVVIDHLAKNPDSRAQGATGTAAKKRAVGGVSLRCKAAEAFTPGKGGAAHLSIAKDRHGGLRAVCPTGDGEPHAGTFRMTTDQTGATAWKVHAPDGQKVAALTDAADLTALLALDPPPKSAEDVRTRMRWGKARALAAMRAYKDRPVPVLGTPPMGEYRSTDEYRESTAAGQDRYSHTTQARGTEYRSCTVCRFPMTDLGDGATTHPTCEA